MTPTLLFMLWLFLRRAVLPMLVYSGRLLSLFSWLSCLCVPILWAAWFLGFVAACAMSAEAGWFPWTSAKPDPNQHHQLEQAAEVARDAARVATQAIESQARQASSQAEQNARVAELLGQLSAERESLAARTEYLAELKLEDSAWAAALNASGPVVVCVAGLCVAGLALWLVSRPGPRSQFEAGELATAMELLVDGAFWEREPGDVGLASAGLPGLPGLHGLPGEWAQARNVPRLPGSDLASQGDDDSPPASEQQHADSEALDPVGELMPF